MTLLRQISVAFCYIIFVPAWSQNSADTIPALSGDLDHAIVLSDSIFTLKPTPKGYGNVLEFSGNDISDSLYVEDEHNTVWYKYTAPCPCELTFDIVPKSIGDDYDFMLFRFAGAAATFSDRVQKKIVRPVRSCISRNDKSLKSMTGLSKDEYRNYIHQGVGPSYVASLPVNKGDVLYLMVDNVYTGGSGHAVKFHCAKPKPGSYFVGYKLDIGTIYFVPEEDTILATSYPVLDSLVAILKKHPTMKIEIGGHVNAPTSAFKPRRWTIAELSKARARRVMEYCINQGIDRKRMTPVGYGNTKMIYPNATNLEQYKANMRVEIIVKGI